MVTLYFIFTLAPYLLPAGVAALAVVRVGKVDLGVRDEVDGDRRVTQHLGQMDN